MRQPLNGLEDALEVIETLYDTEVIVEVRYYEPDPCEGKEGYQGDYSNTVLTTRMLATLDNVELIYNKRRSHNGTVLESPYLMLFFDAIETTEGLLTTEVTLPLEDEHNVLADRTPEGGIAISTMHRWSLRVTPTREPVRHRMHELLDKHQRIDDQG